MRKFNNILAFYKSTLAINLAVFIIGFFFGGFNYLNIFVLSFGFVLSILFKEIYRKNEFLFYFNNGISKTSLIGFSFIFNTIFSGFLILIINLLFH